jgi:hypothetical protein
MVIGPAFPDATVPAAALEPRAKNTPLSIFPFPLLVLCATRDRVLNVLTLLHLQKAERLWTLPLCVFFSSLSAWIHGWEKYLTVTV